MKRTPTLLLAIVFVALIGSSQAQLLELRELIELLPAKPSSNQESQLPLSLQLDDGSAELAFGIASDSGAAQFAWFNRFELPTGLALIHLEEVWILFPENENIAPGSPIQLVIYVDSDHDTANSAELAYASDHTVEVADGFSFSRYQIEPRVRVDQGQDLLIGLVNRWVDSGTSPLHSPGAVDTNQPIGASWFAVWPSDPPQPPLLETAVAIERLDDFQPAAAGNWMIRGFASGPLIVEIDTLESWNLALLALLIGIAGVAALRAFA